VITDRLHTAIDLFLYGLVHVMLNDIISGLKEDPELLADHIISAMPEELAQYIPL